MTITCTRGAAYEYAETETGKRYFSVSQVRAEMWDGFQHVTPEVLALAQQRGTSLHRRFALCLGAMLDLCVYPKTLPAYPGYCDSMDAFMQEYTPIPIKIEEPSVCEKLGVAGTPDALVRMGGFLSLPDLKSGHPTPVDAVQVLCYHRMTDYTDAQKLFDIYLQANGSKATLHEVKPAKHLADWAAFLSAINLLRWRASL